MNILFISYHYWPPHFGGELKLSIERFQSLAERGHTITVLTSGVPGLPDQEDKNGIHLKRSPHLHESRLGRGLRRILFPIWAFFQMQKMELDILHHGGTGGIDPITNCLGMLLVIGAAKRKHAKTVHVHSLADTETEMFTNRGFFYKTRDLWMKHIDSIVSVSPALESAVSRYHGCKSFLLTNGIHDDVFQPIDTTCRQKNRILLGIDQSTVVFTFVGSVGYRKGFDLLADAFGKLSKHHPNWMLWVIGPVSKADNQNIDENEVEVLKAKIDNSKVRYFGKINNSKQIVDMLNLSDVFVFPTRKEGMPLSPIEAMSCGLPIIISKITGVTDMLTIDGETGLFCQVDDENSLSTAMQILGTNKLLRTDMGNAARNLVVSNFSWKKHIDDWERHYSSLVNRPNNVDSD